MGTAQCRTFPATAGPESQRRHVQSLLRSYDSSENSSESLNIQLEKKHVIKIIYKCPAPPSPQMNRWGYIYVENLTWVWLGPGGRILALPSPLARASHLTLFIFRKEGERAGTAGTACGRVSRGGCSQRAEIMHLAAKREGGVGGRRERRALSNPSCPGHHGAAVAPSEARQSEAACMLYLWAACLSARPSCLREEPPAPPPELTQLPPPPTPRCLAACAAGEGKDIELRHQRNPDVSFDCLAREPSECPPSPNFFPPPFDCLAPGPSQSQADAMDLRELKAGGTRWARGLASK